MFSSLREHDQIPPQPQPIPVLSAASRPADAPATPSAVPPAQIGDALERHFDTPPPESTEIGSHSLDDLSCDWTDNYDSWQQNGDRTRISTSLKFDPSKKRSAKLVYRYCRDCRPHLSRPAYPTNDIFVDGFEIENVVVRAKLVGRSESYSSEDGAQVFQFRVMEDSSNVQKQEPFRGSPETLPPGHPCRKPICGLAPPPLQEAASAASAPEPQVSGPKRVSSLLVRSGIDGVVYLRIEGTRMPWVRVTKPPSRLGHPQPAWMNMPMPCAQ